MVAVVIRLRPIDLAELEILVLAHLRARHGPVAVPKFGLYPHDLRIEGADACRGPGRYLELDIRDAERYASEARGIRLMAAHAIAPGTCCLDVVIVLAERERGTVQLVGDRREPIEQGLAAGDDDPGMAPEHLRLAARQMKLASADVDPHIGVGHHQIGVAGKPEPGDIKQWAKRWSGTCTLTCSRWIELPRSSTARSNCGCMNAVPDALRHIIAKRDALIQQFGDEGCCPAGQKRPVMKPI